MRVGWGGGEGDFFLPNKILKKKNTPKYAQNLVVTRAKPNSLTALLSPPPRFWLVSLMGKREARVKNKKNRLTNKHTSTLTQDS